MDSETDNNNGASTEASMQEVLVKTDAPELNPLQNTALDAITKAFENAAIDEFTNDDWFNNDRLSDTDYIDELDLDETIRSTADKGYIDVQLRPERRNAVKVLLFLDVGGSMDWHVEEAEQLFSAAQSQFKRLEHFYFHNCLYESVWKSNRRRHEERIGTRDLLNSYGRDYRVVFVGDASMSPYEIVAPGGSVEHLNPEAGQAWLERAFRAWPRTVWINPTPDTASDGRVHMGVSSPTVQPQSLGMAGIFFVSHAPAIGP